MSTIGVLGAGRVGTSLARALATAGRAVILGDRASTADARSRDLPDSVRVADQITAATEADVVINATPGETSLERLTALRDQLAGKVLVDVSNATLAGPDGLPEKLVYTDSSLAEQLQESLPATRVVKTLNTMLFTAMTAPRSLAVPPTVFLSGDDDEAKNTVSGLLGDLGWRPEWIEDLGGIATARGTEALILLVPPVLRRNGFQPFAISLAR